MLLTCNYCGRGFERRHPDRRYSMPCCTKRHAMLLAKAHSKHAYKGWVINTRGYLLVRLPGHPMANKNDQVFYHRLVMSYKIGRHLLSSERVHHIDSNRQNNKPDNLELLSDGAHRRLEYAKREVGKDGRLLPVL